MSSGVREDPVRRRQASARFPRRAGWKWLDAGGLTGDGKTWNAGVFLKFPFFDGLATQGRVIEARSDLRSSQIELAKAEDGVRLEVRTAVDAVRESGLIVRALAGTVTQARRLLQMSEKGFEFGVKTRLEVDDAQLAVVQAEETSRRPPATTSWRGSRSGTCRGFSSGREGCIPGSPLESGVMAALFGPFVALFVSLGVAGPGPPSGIGAGATRWHWRPSPTRPRSRSSSRRSTVGRRTARRPRGRLGEEESGSRTDVRRRLAPARTSLERVPGQATLEGVEIVKASFPWERDGGRALLDSLRSAGIAR